MTILDAIVLADAARLREELSDQGLRPYVDFEILTATVSDGTVEIDPGGDPERLLPHLDRFAGANGYLVMPCDPDLGTVALILDR